MRDLASDVVRNVGLGNAVSGGAADPTSDCANDARATHKLTVEGGKSATGEGEGGSLVMGQSGVGVLEEGNEDKPVVNLQHEAG